MTGCGDLQRPKIEPFIAQTLPPAKQELRWSNGKMAKSLDPARAAAAPETDLIRAVYEGLTDLDSKSLNEIPGVAERWESSADQRVWTFYLRRDSRWSNDELVTAPDFVRTFKRLRSLGDKAANSFLFHNIVGMRMANSKVASDDRKDFLDESIAEPRPEAEPRPSAGDLPKESIPAIEPTPAEQPKAQKSETTPGAPLRGAEPAFGVQAVNDLTLRISLELPDKDLPKLVANPIFRPIYGDASGLENIASGNTAITNGAFRVKHVSGGEIVLERSENYWNNKAVRLDVVRFISAGSAEAALQAYKRGDVDVVSNAAFEPLALKLLTPFEDFRRTPHNALNFYAVNTQRPPFNDRRVREALAVSIDRTKLTDADLEGTTQAASTFSPLSEKKIERLTFDIEKARKLLEYAGFPDGRDFPAIRLVINRNNTQQRVARSVAKMWKQNLNIDCTIEIKEASEMDEVWRSGEFDLIRRGMVLPVNDELVSLISIFGSPTGTGSQSETDLHKAAAPSKELPSGDRSPGYTSDPDAGTDVQTTETAAQVLTETQALFELKALPLYFPMSYSLVKPYVQGFEVNGLDAPSLREVSIDSAWQPRP